jgi:G3E family GTPase
MFIDLVRSLHGPKLLRLKGIVKIAEEPDRPLVIPASNASCTHRFDWRWPDADERT